MVLDATLLTTQHYKERIKGKVEQSREEVVAIEKGAFGSPSTTVTNFTFYFQYSNGISIHMNLSRDNINKVGNIFLDNPNYPRNENHHHHHHHVMPLARISLTFSRHFSLSFTASQFLPGSGRIDTAVSILLGR